MLGTFLVMAGMLMILNGFILIIFASRNSAKQYSKEGSSATYSHSDYSGTSAGNAQYEPVTNKTEVRGGGIIMLGPIPLIIGSDSSTTKTLVILAIVLMVLYFLIFM